MAKLEYDNTGGIFRSMTDAIKTLFNRSAGSGDQPMQNDYNRAFFATIGQNYTNYDNDGQTYIDKGYNENSTVYSVLTQMITKTTSIPYYFKDVVNEAQAKQIAQKAQLLSNNNPLDYIKYMKFKNTAFSTDEDTTMPLERPNPLQSWSEFFGAIKGYLRVNGNAYIYKMCAKSGLNYGVPMGLYVLPSHKVSIILRADANMLTTENPVSHYLLIDGVKYRSFEAEDIVHIKLGNLNFDMNGAHLYGQSPLRAILKNIQCSNEAINNNIKTMINGGAFGFIHGKQQPLGETQAAQIKARLKEMDRDTTRLGKITGISQDIGFTRVSLTTEELRPFEYLEYDQKQICNALGWSDKLLNSDDGAKYDNVKEFRKQVVVDNIMPDLHLIEEAFNTEILPFFGGAYKGKRLYFDVTELPEMQMDMNELISWVVLGVKTALITRNEARAILKYDRIEAEGMDDLTVDANINSLESAIAMGFGNMVSQVGNLDIEDEQ